MTSRSWTLAIACAVALAGAAAAQDAPAVPPQDEGVPPAEAPPAPEWLPQQGADLIALDKISARTAKLSLKVGQSATFGSLTITLRACDVRPPDRPPDATAWLDITDSTPDAPQFHGWLVKSDPAVSGFEHPAYDVRLAGCH